jgi:hypothetical protein
MLPAFLVPEGVIHANGESAPVELNGVSGPDAILVTLGITHVVEQEALTVSIFGSTDGAAWGAAPLAIFPQKFYTGVSTLVIDLTEHPQVSFLRAQWKVVRWGRGDKTPSFTMYVFVEPA